MQKRLEYLDGQNRGFVQEAARCSSLTTNPNVEIHLCKFDETAYTRRHFAQFGILFPDSLNSAVDKRQAHFLAGRIAAASGLAHMGATQLDVGFDHERVPIWPLDYCGSISHTEGIAISVCARCDMFHSVGIDIETAGDRANMEAIIPIAVTKEEVALFTQNANSTSPQFAALVIFSAKEALYKTLYPVLGMFIDYLEVALTAYQPDTKTLRICLVRELAGGFPAGRSFDIVWCTIDQRVASLCLLEK